MTVYIAQQDVETRVHVACLKILHVLNLFQKVKQYRGYNG